MPYVIFKDLTRGEQYLTAIKQGRGYKFSSDVKDAFKFVSASEAYDWASRHRELKTCKVGVRQHD
jgi:hypothetical protein